MNLFVNQEVERRVREWLVTAKGTDFVKLLEDTTREVMELRKDVYWNVGTKPIFISQGVVADPAGGPGRGETTYCVVPGEGIDLGILGLSRRRPSSQGGSDQEAGRGDGEDSVRARHDDQQADVRPGQH